MSQQRRKSVDTLTSEQREFLGAGVNVARTRTEAGPPRPPIGTTRTEQLTRPGTESDSNTALITRSRRTRAARHPVTLRLSSDVAEELRQVSAIRSINYEEPWSQQGIVEDALRRWLSRHS